MSAGFRDIVYLKQQYSLWVSSQYFHYNYFNQEILHLQVVLNLCGDTCVSCSDCSVKHAVWPRILWRTLRSLVRC